MLQRAAVGVTLWTRVEPKEGKKNIPMNRRHRPLFCHLSVRRHLTTVQEMIVALIKQEWVLLTNNNNKKNALLY